MKGLGILPAGLLQPEGLIFSLPVNIGCLCPPLIDSVVLSVGAGFPLRDAGFPPFPASCCLPRSGAVTGFLPDEAGLWFL